MYVSTEIRLHLACFGGFAIRRIWGKWDDKTDDRLGIDCNIQAISSFLPFYFNTFLLFLFHSFPHLFFSTFLLFYLSTYLHFSFSTFPLIFISPFPLFSYSYFPLFHFTSILLFFFSSFLLFHFSTLVLLRKRRREKNDNSTFNIKYLN